MNSQILWIALLAAQSIICNAEYNGTVTNEYVKNFFPSNATSVDLDSKEIEIIDAGALLEYYDLKKLDLSNNLIASLDDNTFINQVKLEELNLSNNKLVSLNRKSFILLSKLQKLLLESNKIVRIDRYTFVGLASLKAVCLFDNPVSNLYPASLQPLCQTNPGCLVTYKQSCSSNFDYQSESPFSN